jgi:Cellulase (glycosyl hydrolase family 5)
LRGLVVAVIGALAVAAPAHAGGPTMRVGVTADIAKQPDLMLATAEVQRARLAGYDSVRLTQYWFPGQTEPTQVDLQVLRNVVDAAALQAMPVYLSVSHPGSRTTPLTAEAREQFSQFVAALARALPSVLNFTIGNEPNLNRFWLPQFNEDGSDAAAPAYLELLAQAYDALKAVSPRIVVVGGAVSPRGSDNPALPRHTHSPTQFILDLGAAYRASGRDRPIMDAFAIHPFADNSSVAPAVPHPTTTSIGVADYGKLVALLGRAFDGTAQRGSTLPIYYNEFGVESVPPAGKRALYLGEEPDTTKPVDERTQGAYYRQAVQLAFCQPNVRGLFLFLTIDDTSLPGWQSGLFYPDRTAKASLPAVRSAARQSRGGVVARCPAMRLTPKVTGLAFPQGAELRARRLAVRFRCDIDCTYVLRLERVGRRTPVTLLSHTALGGRDSLVRLPALRLEPGDYRFRISFVAPVNRGATVSRTSPVFRIG